MAKSSDTAPSGHVGSLIISALFVVVGIVTLYDTTGYSDRDSKVFPQTVAIILIITASLAFVVQFLKRTEEPGFGMGSWWRRCLLIVALLLTCFAMPVVGFLPASVIAFSGGLIAAMHDRWTLRTVLLYWSAGAVIVVSFYALFKYGLYVPLP